MSSTIPMKCTCSFRSLFPWAIVGWSAVAGGSTKMVMNMGNLFAARLCFLLWQSVTTRNPEALSLETSTCLELLPPQSISKPINSYIASRWTSNNSHVTLQTASSASCWGYNLQCSRRLRSKQWLNTFSLYNAVKADYHGIWGRKGSRSTLRSLAWCRYYGREFGLELVRMSLNHLTHETKKRCTYIPFDASENVWALRQWRMWFTYRTWRMSQWKWVEWGCEWSVQLKWSDCVREFVVGIMDEIVVEGREV
jgi:hypothetical protein